MDLTDFELAQFAAIFCEQLTFYSVQTLIGLVSKYISLWNSQVVKLLVTAYQQAEGKFTK